MAGVAQQAPVLIKQMHRSRLCGCQSRNSRLVFVFAIIFLCGARSRALTATVTTSRGRGVAGLTLSRGSNRKLMKAVVKATAGGDLEMLAPTNNEHVIWS